jgi:hypothetical protein
MDPELNAYRRVLIKAYHDYLSADCSLQIATQTAEAWMRIRPERRVLLIGDPGSPIRQLYEKRERALARLMRLRDALKEAEVQFARQDAQKRGTRVFRFIGYKLGQ